MSTLLGFLLGMLAVVGAFGFIIFIHEMGHFLTARAVDIRCPHFAIGFGPQIFGFRWRGTNFAVRLFPLGGYVLMQGEEPGATTDPWSEAVTNYLGEESFPAPPEQLLAKLKTFPEDERGEAWQEVHDQVAFARTKSFPNLKSVEGNFHDRSIPARVLVISGGVIMNFMAATLLFWFLAPVKGVGSFFQEWSPTVSIVEPESPAQDAGLEGGDRILEINGRQIGTFLGAVDALAGLPGVPTKLVWERRGGEKIEKSLTPMIGWESARFRLDEKGGLVLVHSTEHPEMVGKSVLGPKLDVLLSTLRKPGVKNLDVEFASPGKPTKAKFVLPEGFSGPRGQIGIRFGVSDIRFENKDTTVIASVRPDSPAAAAGVQVGDELIKVDGFPVVANNGQGFGSMVEPAMEAFARLSEPNVLALTVRRADEFLRLEVDNSKRLLTRSDLGIELVPLSDSDKLTAPFRLIKTLFLSPYEYFRAWVDKRATGAEIVESMQGPVGIMGLIYHLSDNGFYQFLFFIGLLNAAIGAFNLLPFPALDGARLVFLVIAGLRGGRQIDPDKEARVHLVGLMILLCFVVVVTFGDIKKLLAAQLFVM